MPDYTINQTDIFIKEPQPNNIIMNVNSNADQQEMLRIGPDGFYIRGKKVPVDENEGLAVFKALKRFLVEAELRRNY